MQIGNPQHLPEAGFIRFFGDQIVEERFGLIQLAALQEPHGVAIKHFQRHLAVRFGLEPVQLFLAAAFLAVVAGLVQRNPKALLAYSTISQMGVMTAGVGVGFKAPET
ncbi:MAG: proton-conducting transporter membrane subunit, partial [Rhodospirillales bacterium]